LPSIVNTFFTLNFALFLILFPITSCIIIALSKEDNLSLDLLQVIFGIIIGFLLSLLIFGQGSGFLLFGLFYLISHIVLELLTYHKFKEKESKKIFSVSNYSTSKIGLLLTLSLFIVIILIIHPHQQESARSMEAGVVNMFVGDDIGNWLGTTYNISKISTKSSVDYITSTPEYKKLSEVKDPKVEAFTDYMSTLSTELAKPTTDKEIKDAYANLDDKTLKNQLVNTIHSIPLMIVVEEYFAFVFALLLASLAQLYFVIAFSLLGLLYVYIFYNLFAIEK